MSPHTLHRRDKESEPPHKLKMCIDCFMACSHDSAAAVSGAPLRTGHRVNMVAALSLSFMDLQCFRVFVCMSIVERKRGHKVKEARKRQGYDVFLKGLSAVCRGGQAQGRHGRPP